MGFIKTRSITETNRLLVAGANVVATRLGLKRDSKRWTEDPWWKKRIKKKIKLLRQDISRVERLITGYVTRTEMIQSLRRKYRIREKGPAVVLEELKQRLAANSAKLRRYEERQHQYRQNKTFENNQRGSLKRLKE